MSGLRLLRLLFSGLVLVLGVVSCTRQPEAPAVAPASAQPAAVAETPAVPLERSVLLTYYSGVVDKYCADAWLAADIGDRLAEGDSVRTGTDSFCELQIGQAAVVRLESETLLAIGEVLATTGKSNATVNLGAGSLLAKVQKLSDTDRFRVKTKSAVCGVRGTQFGVSVREDGDTLVSVKTGRVAVLPAAADVDAIKKTVQETLQAAPAAGGATPEEQQKTLEALQERLDALEASAPVIEPNQELVVAAATSQEVTQALVAVQEQAVEMARSATPPAEAQMDALRVAVASATRAVAVEVAEPTAISKESAQTLEVTDRMRILEVPMTATPGEAATTQPAPEPRALSVVVTPADAEITLDGSVVARGSYHGLFAQGETLEMMFRLEGYKTQTLRITVDRDAQDEYRVGLEEDLRPVSVRVTPTDATVVLDGKTVGTGGYTGSHRVGQRLSLMVQRAGYHSVTQEILVAATGDLTYVVNLERSVEDVSIQAAPSSAEILVNGRSAGTGRYETSVEPGTRLEVTVRKDGYVPQSFVVSVPKGGLTRTVTLEVATETFTISATPRDADILIDGVARSKGTFTGSFPVGTKVAVSVRREGYETSTFQIDVRSGSGARQDVTLARKMGKVALQVDVADARVLRDGKVVGTGSYTGEGPLGEPVALRVERLGYASQDVTLEPAEGAVAARRVSLEPRPVLWRQAAGSGPFTWSAALDGPTVYLADKAGTLHALSVGGGVLWSVPTGNSPNENSVPVLAGGTVYLSGSKELVAVDARSGSVRARINLAPNESHIFGRRVTATGTTLVVPADDGLRMLDPASLKLLRSVVVRDGSQMSVRASGTELYIVNQQGVFLALDPENGVIRWETATEAVQPIALAPTVVGRKAYFAGRKGGVACIDLDGHRVVWQTTLEPGKSVGVFQDLGVTGDLLLAYSKGVIYALSASTGKRVYEPLREATTPALVAGGMLYYGKTDGSLVIADPATGRQRAAFRLDGTAVTQPLASGNTILVGTDRGEVLQLLPEVILRVSGG